jgi:predicted dehydrogenase
MQTKVSRRSFLRHTAAGVAGFALGAPHIAVGARKVSPNEKLNLGVIGVGGRGGDNLRGVASENIVALCDVDDQRLAAAKQSFPEAKTFHDFRELVDLKNLDAIVVSTPDHTHAVCAVAALKSGRHVYCEKPLTRTVSEARIVTELARKEKLVTQLGTQIHAENNYRRVVELVRRGVIGQVAEVHVWVNVSYGGKDLPTDKPPVPAHLHYDLWLGPVEPRPYHPAWVPFAWRNWWHFGGGALADFGCHYMDLPFWALDLSQPVSVEPVDGPPVHRDSTPPWLIVRYRFPAREGKPPVTLTWYHGGKQPEHLLDEEQKKQWKSGVLFLGENGRRIIANYSHHALLPENEFENFQRPAPFIPNSIGHHKEWLEAIKNGGQTTCRFDYSGPLTETALLGNVAYRVGRKLEWDAKKLRATNCPAAGDFLQHHYRKGWRL